MAQLKNTTVDGTLTVSGNNIYLDNGKIIYAKNTEGENRSLVQTNANGEYFFGWGGYSNREGASYVDGNVVNIRSRGGVYVTDPDAGLNGRAYGQNKVLWSGAIYMAVDGSGNAQRVTLSESVSAQPNGIVLVWSLYTNGAAENAGFNYIFVPKQHIASFSGCGVSCDLKGYANSTGTNAYGFKYVYVNDTNIVGNVNNNYVGASNGLTLNSNLFVLRQVIGV